MDAASDLRRSLKRFWLIAAGMAAVLVAWFFVDLERDSRILRSECSGPLLRVQRASIESQALREIRIEPSPENVQALIERLDVATKENRASQLALHHCARRHGVRSALTRHPAELERRRRVHDIRREVLRERFR